MNRRPEHMSDLMTELSLALKALAVNMSDLAAALENDYMAQSTLDNDGTHQKAMEVIEKARLRQLL